MDASLVPVLAAAVVAVAAGVLVYLLVPKRRPAGEVDPAVEVHPEAGVVQQRPSRSTASSLLAAAPAGYLAWLERQVVRAGRPAGWTDTAIVTWKLALGVVGVVGLVLLLIAGGPQPLDLLLGGGLALALFFLPDVRIHSRAHDRQQAIGRALPDTLDQMTIAVEAGLGFDAAMSKAARAGSGPVAEELVRVLQDMSIGRTRRDAFVELERRTDVEDLRRFVRAVVQADAYGIAVGEVLRVQSAEMRLKRRQRAEEQAQKVTVKILFPLVFCLLPVLFIVVMTPAVIGIVEAFSAAT